MLGFASTEIVLAYIGCIVATLLCIIYGLFMWNKGKEISGEEFKQKVKWVKEERTLKRDVV
jgi:nicotinamide riboside transporter PnuC